MKLSLELVRETLRRTLGRDSFIASYISRIEEAESIKTAAISAEGRLVYNPKFTRTYIKSEEDLFCLLLHEILHPLFYHYMYGGSNIANIAADALINAVIAEFYPEESGGGSLFRKLYRPEGIQLILRPGSNPGGTRWDNLYSQLYFGRATERLTTGDIIQALKVLLDREDISGVVLVGSHTAEEALPAGVRERIAREILSSIEYQTDAGYGRNLCSVIIKIIRTHQSLKRKLLSGFLTRKRFGQFLEHDSVRRRITSPLPFSPTKRDVVLLASDFWPGYFHNRTQGELRKRKGLAIYLDVSGSVSRYLPKIIGLLRCLKKEVNTVYLFSNKVVEIKLNELIDEGRLSTTYGTDFDCVADSILDNGYDKAVVITDGYASLSDEKAKELKKRRVSILTILFGGSKECDPLMSFGPVVRIEEIVEGR